MFKNLILLASLILTTNVLAQKKGSEQTKATEKPAESKIDYKEIGAPMPPLFLLPYYDTANGKTVKNRKPYITGHDLNGSVVVMMFNPTCSHCMDETMLLEKNIELFRKTHLVLLANKTMTPYMPDFYKSMHIEDYPSITIGFDSTNFVNELFLYHALPQLEIYDYDHKLVKTFAGEIAIDSLKPFLK